MPDEQETAIPVLLVEDNEIDVEITKRVLAASGLNVRLAVARDGNEALDVLFGTASRKAARPEEEEPPRLIMLDLGLPGIDGREVLRRVKNDPGLCPIPVAVLTGSTGKGPMLECMHIGGNMYFVKPMTVADALNVISAVQKYWALIEQLQRRTAA